MPSLVSVIVTTYNRVAVLSEAIDSFFAQTYRPIELIIIDDGSTDNTKHIIIDWKRKHGDDEQLSIHFLYQENAGAPSARNRGINESRGEYIQFFDSDDILHHERFEKIVYAYRKYNCDYVYTGYSGFCGICGGILLAVWLSIETFLSTQVDEQYNIIFITI